MHIVYANAGYPRDDTRGKSAKIRQIIDTSVRLGHTVSLMTKDGHPSVPRIPADRFGRYLALRQMDAVLTLIEATPPYTCRYGIAPYRQILPKPVKVWEFNTIPEFLLVLGRSQAELGQTICEFRRYAPGCDLAICVSNAIAEYVKNDLGIHRTVVIPNGSDPDLFRPDATPNRRVKRNHDQLNVVWMGSAELSWHNFDLMRGAAEILWQRGYGKNIVFHIIGGHFTMMGDMPANVNYYGGADYLTIPHWLAGMDVGLCLYHPGVADYNSPLKLFDYMSSGLAVIATIQPQVCEVFDLSGQSEMAVSPHDPGLLADLLWQLFLDRGRVAQLGNVNRQLIIDRYNWTRAVTDMYRAIETGRMDRDDHRSN